jgi:serine/threonine protein kinase
MFTTKKPPAASSIVKATSETAVYNNFVRIQTKEDVFDKYEVLQNFGSGSMGCVYKVRVKPDAVVPSNMSTTKRKSIVSSLRSSLSNSLTKKKEEPRRPARKNGDDAHAYALKSILLDRISSEFLEELQNEIAILRSMDHPNIVKAYEVFYVNATRKHMGMIYLVLELCDGGDLYTRSPYTEKDAAKIVQKLLSAVRYMHDRGVVHRDLKYENILFENPSPSAEIKVIDFGLSKKFKSGTPGIMTERVGTM